MCCTNSHNSTPNYLQVTPCVTHCGCGCIGKNQTTLRLKHYQEHLKDELKSVERQISALQEP
jgi:hypothetical protein